MDENARTETESRKLLMALMTRHQRQVFSYIFSMVPHREDAEDLLQETSQIICERFNAFTPGTDFTAWACRIAYWRIRYARQRYARSKVIFNQEILDAVAQTAAPLQEELDERHVALAGC